MDQTDARLIGLVAGAAGGVGQGVACGLAESGATVFLTGRPTGTTDERLYDVAERVTRAGGTGRAFVCDHTDPASVSKLIGTVRETTGRLDVVVSAVYPQPSLPDRIPRSRSGRTPTSTPFWELPLDYWDALQLGSLRAHFLLAFHVAPLMAAAGRGVIVNLSSAGADDYWFNVAYGVDKAAVEKMTHDTAHELKPHGVTSLAIRLPTIRTAAVLAGFGEMSPQSRSPQFVGRIVAYLARDSGVAELSGLAIDLDRLAERYGLRDDPTNE